MDCSADLLEPFELRSELRDFSRFPIAPLLESSRPAIHQQCLDIQRQARELCDRHVVGHVAEWDARARTQHGFVPWPVIEASLPYGFLSMNVPAIFGGGNLGPTPTGVFAEEIASVDAGLFVIFGAHALGLSMILGSLDTGLILRFGREISEGEKRGEAVLFALAHTEPSGGSDVEDVDDIQRARVGSRCTKVDGGYVVNARKVFISNASFARYTVLSAFGDPNRPLESLRGFIIPNDAPGFSIGRVEHKMGQRVAATAEVLCDDVFVPDSHVLRCDDNGRLIDTVLSLSRAPVGAMATGILRGTIEHTLAYLSQKRVRGHWLFEEQWVQLILADMLASLQAARGLYMDAAFASEAWGFGRLLEVMPRGMPAMIRSSRLYRALMNHSSMVKWQQGIYRSQVSGDTLQRIVSHASMAKYVGSDLAVRMAMKAMEVLGEDANDPTWGVEKCMRDAKLAQIFEGTNQINRLHVTRGILNKRQRSARGGTEREVV